MPSELLSAALEKSVNGALSVIELARVTEMLRLTEGRDSVVALFQTWIDHNDGDPLLFAALYNFAVAQTDYQDLSGAEASYERAIALNPDFMPARINLGRIQERLGSSGQAVLQWKEIVDRLATVTGGAITHKTIALNQIARVLEFNNQDESAETALRQSLELDPHQREPAQHLIALRQRQCKWPVIEPFERVDHDLLMGGISPLSMAVLADDPMMQLAANAHYNRRDVGHPGSGLVTSHWAAREGGLSGRLRIGYLSSDLRMHAVGFLMAEVFELHDRDRVEIFAYYTGPDGEDSQQARIRGSVDHWLSLNGLDDATAARRIADDGIHILVDVNGYTRDGRTRLVAMRPAPVIVNWLGFPGSMASPYHHYIIADDWIVPPGAEIYFSETVLRLPCYQPNDRKRVVSPTAPTRADAGLPEDAMVYCCFNGTHKINRFTFERWLTILARVPGSVLWLLDSTDTAQARLRDSAMRHGIAEDRLIFAPKAANPDHLARYPLADLFLDTLPYGAHTTASDALWMGVPMLTLSGRSFASRVSGSLLRAAGLPEMVCLTPDEYVDRAVALGRNRPALAPYRERLRAGRDSCLLFDTATLVHRLEDLYRGMWADFEAGQLPRPDLSNLDVYFEIGGTQDYDNIELQSVSDYEGWWREKLAARDAVRPIPADHRLWPDAGR
ncbi:MAG: glycosyl transferase [Telmatospirillum sp.]|nr:glycosyl transferase [Telmatospirillum sp.]